MNHGRTLYVPAEPCSVSASEITDVLRRIGWHSSADLVTYLAQKSKSANVEAMQWRDAYCETLAKLHKHEPPAPRAEPINYQPPPEASD